MFKKTIAFIGLAALALVWAAASAPAAETVKLTYSNFFPPTHIQSKLAEQWCREVEKRTGGKVKVDYYPGGTLTKAKNIYDGVVQGLSDVGLSALAYSRGRFPVMAAVDLPMGYPDGATATLVANEVYEQFKPRELADTEPMYFHAHGPGIMCTKKEAVETIEDVKGLKLRATGNSAKVVKAMGGTPVAQSMPEAYQAIQKGVVDGGVYPMETNKGWKMAEVVDYCTKAKPIAYTTTFFVVMNKDKWNALPPDVQKTIREINEEWAVKHGQAWDESDQVGQEFFLSKGGKVLVLDESQVPVWNKAVEPVIVEYEQSAKSGGGKAVVDFITERVSQAR